ncbi:MAG TPA: HipA domain-containing protein [Hyphomonadaceae bacterium]|nr:HipA domain-containing protein [Hyphomonadaceae bacterium]
MAVWLDGFDMPAGILSDVCGSSLFEYNADYRALPHSIPLSMSLPLSESSFDCRKSQPYFANLLHAASLAPEQLAEEKHDGLVDALKISGRDCPGAVSCAPMGEPRAKQIGDLDRDYVQIDDLANLVATLACRQLPAAMRGAESPLAGVQPKIALAIVDGVLCRPTAGAPTTHVLKVQPDDTDHLADNEYACLKLARQLGCAAVNPQRLTIAGKPCLVIPRYDRVIRDRKVYRKHQESFAQALGLTDKQKYEPDVARHDSEACDARYDQSSILALLEKVRQPEEDRRNFLRLTLVNILLGNSDNHANNHALAYSDGAMPELAPAFDLVALPHWPKFAFCVGRARDLASLKAEDLVRFATLTTGTAPDAARACFSTLSDIVDRGRLAMASMVAEDSSMAGLQDYWRARLERLGQLADELRSG